MENRKKKRLLSILLLATLLIGIVGITFVRANLRVDFEQYANLPSNSDDKTWIKSILQQNNSIYYENMLVPQRLLFTTIAPNTGNVHTLTFEHQAMKGGDIHAYDFIGSWDQAALVATNTTVGFGLDATTGWNLNGSNDIVEGALGFVNQADADAYITLVSSGVHVSVNCPDNMSVIDTDLNYIDIAANVAAWESVYGNRQIDIYGNAAISDATLTFNGYVLHGGDAYATYTLQYTSASTELVIQFAGHLAEGSGGHGWCYGEGFGASSINGGSYHFMLGYLDTSSQVSQDNQIKGADIIIPGNPCIDIEKAVSAGPYIVGSEVTYYYNVTNCGNVPLTDVKVYDNVTGQTMPVGTGTLAVGQSVTVLYQYTILVTDQDPLCNNATVAGNYGGTIINDWDEVSIDISHPCVDVLNSVNVTDAFRGEWVEFNVTVVNCGDVDLHIGVTDVLLGINEYVDVAAGQKNEFLVPYQIPMEGPASTYCRIVGWSAPSLADLANALPDTAQINVSYPVPNSYLTVDVLNSTLAGSYAGWCVDTDSAMLPATTYMVNVFSSYEALPVGLFDYPENFDLVNWILNQGFVGANSPHGFGIYTSGDVQRVIWALLEDRQSTTGLGPWDQDRVDEILAAAYANGEGYVPSCGDTYAIVLAPADPALSIQILIVNLGLNCTPIYSCEYSIHNIVDVNATYLSWTGTDYADASVSVQTR